jgi:sugar/nucleoside kinase (ribokinase family)
METTSSGSSSKPAPEIVCLGQLVADTVGRPIDALPPKGTLALLERIELHIGGCGANTAASAARIGLPVALLGKVGADGFGDYLISALTARGVDMRGVRRDPEVPTSATIVTVHSDAERSFLHVSGANGTYRAEDVDWDILSTAKILHIGGMQLMTALEGDGITQVLKEAKRRGILTVLDTVMNPQSPWWDGVKDALPYLDWAVPSFEEAILLTGERTVEGQVARLKGAGVKNVAIKRDAEGSYLAPEAGNPFTVPAMRVTAIDSLGAGDAWVAGFLTGLWHGWPLEKTARFANAVGACCVQALGATTGVRSLAETLKLIGE